MRKGSHHTPESNLKNSLSRMGQPSPNKGKKFSDKWRDNLRIAHLNQKPNEAQLRGLAKGRAIVQKLNYKHGLSSDSYFRNHQKALNGYRRREAARLFGNPHTNKEWEDLKKEYDYTCPSCLKREPEVKLTRDHIISLSKGGSDKIENIQPLCKSCNCKKHTKDTRYSYRSKRYHNLF